MESIDVAVVGGGPARLQVALVSARTRKDGRWRIVSKAASRLTSEGTPIVDLIGQVLVPPLHQIG